jgi:ABC-type Fe3+ transport system permease subunit
LGNEVRAYPPRMKHPANRAVSYLLFALVSFFAVAFLLDTLVLGDDCAAADSSECEHWVDFEAAVLSVVIALLMTVAVVVVGEVLARRRQ